MLPGLIDCHTHLLLNLDPEKSDLENGIASIAEMSTAERALLGSKNAREMLMAGFTIVRDLGNSGLGGDVALRNAIRAGWVTGPRMLVSTRALAPWGDQMPSLASVAEPLIEQEYAIVTGSDQVRLAVRKAIYDGADLIKLIIDGSSNVMSMEEVKAAVDEAHRNHREGRCPRNYGGGSPHRG